MNPWSQFWQQGHPTTFGAYFKEGYEGPIKQWFEARIQLNKTPVSMLELACGNGALISMALDFGLKGRYLGIDLAEVSIPNGIETRLKDQSQLEAHIRGGVSIEAIPLESHHFDYVCSIFGIEYSNVAKTIPEIARVLQSKGHFLGVLHHCDSVVSTMSARALNEYNLKDVRDFIDQLEVIARQARGLSDLRALAQNPKAEKARKKINGYADQYLGNTDLETANASMFEFVTHGLQFFKALNHGPVVTQHFIKSLYAETLGTRERHKQMCSVALTEQQMNQFCDLLIKAGFNDPDVTILASDDVIIGWAICAQKLS